MVLIMNISLDYFIGTEPWETALALDKTMATDIYPKRFTLYKEIYRSPPVTRIERIRPFKKANVWNVDTGAAFKGPLTIMDVDTKEFWQSEPLTQLYFDEKGRN
jgi:serine/threonine protein phosphatase 1